MPDEPNRHAQFVNATSGSTITINNPATGQLVAEVQSASTADVDAAVAAAQAAFPAWSALTGKQRAVYLRKLGALIETNADELGDLEVISIGKAKSGMHLENSWAREYVDTAEAVFGDTSLNQPGFLNLSIRQPFGVVGAIIRATHQSKLPCSFPYPLRSAPAVAAGNCIVLKSSEKTPLQALALARLTKEAGFPPGVVNVLSGDGAIGGHIAGHMDIRKVSFTGSTSTGRRVQAAAANSNLKVVTLELGGKAPTIVFADANLKNAVDAVVMSNLVLSGQTCVVSTSRVYVQESLAPTFLEHLKGSYAGWTQLQGDPTDLKNVLGTVADVSQAERIQEFLDIGKKDGKVAAGGDRDGAFVHPTIFTDVGDDSKLNREEVFGPVLVFHTFKDEEEAIRRANDTEYALYASVFTKDIDRAIRVAKRLESGQVGINTASPTLHVDMPFGGWKQSGYGKGASIASEELREADSLAEMGRHWVENWCVCRRRAPNAC
ncbi:aldehyde dehydrogenase [Auriscalpium vulgare]|uniref:Aldehyde dehydrogenase n=1 Tax=Auriscalpium vulgare TaxID=40419 RepID=A0ACB8R5D7_9AGAM|nr:aldehyde dehydrogenase [Auriscalpium vulgare]